MLTNLIQYDYSAREYTVTAHGREVAFPAGPTGRKNATRLAIHAANPEAYRMAATVAEQHTQLESRAWRATALVVDGKVKPGPVQAVLAAVEGSSEWGDYLITALDGELMCDCPDYAGGGAPLVESGARYCKHLLAHVFSRQL
jgi:hypothetical protein